MLWALDLPAGPRPEPPGPASRPFEVAPADAGRLAAAMGPDGRVVQARLARGCRCFAAWAGGELAAYAWVTLGEEWIGEVCASFRPPPGDAYVWNCFTLPRHRRRGLYTGLVRRVGDALEREGVPRLWLATVDDAPHAVAGVRRAGFTPVVGVRCRQIAAWRLARAEPLPGAPAALVAAARAGLGLGLGRRRRMVH